VKVAIFGAGLAGPLAAAALGAHADTILLVGSTRRAQAGHAHRIPREGWEALRALCPALVTGAPSGDDGLPRLSQDELQRRLLAALPGHTRRLEAATLSLDIETWRVDGAPFDIIIDATGARRASLRALVGSPWEFSEDHLGDEIRCASALVRGRIPERRDPRCEEGLFTLWEGADRTRVTLYLSPLRPAPASAKALLDRAGIDAEPVAALERYGGRACSLLVTDDDERPPPPGWLALGDALLGTPPRYGLGIWSLANQCARLRELRSPGELAAIRRQLAAFAATMWEHVLFQEALARGGEASP
jgi:hypothetical protein